MLEEEEAEEEPRARRTLPRLLLVASRCRPRRRRLCGRSPRPPSNVAMNASVVSVRLHRVLTLHGCRSLSPTTSTPTRWCWCRARVAASSTAPCRARAPRRSARTTLPPCIADPIGMARSRCSLRMRVCTHTRGIVAQALAHRVPELPRPEHVQGSVRAAGRQAAGPRSRSSSRRHSSTSQLTRS